LESIETNPFPPSCEIYEGFPPPSPSAEPREEKAELSTYLRKKFYDSESRVENEKIDTGSGEKNKK